MSDEAKAKISAAMRGVPKTEAHRRNVSRGLVRMHALRKDAERRAGAAGTGA